MHPFCSKFRCLCIFIFHHMTFVCSIQCMSWHRFCIWLAAQKHRISSEGVDNLSKSKILLYRLHARFVFQGEEVLYLDGIAYYFGEVFCSRNGRRLIKIMSAKAFPQKAERATLYTKQTARKLKAVCWQLICAYFVISLSSNSCTSSPPIDLVGSNLTRLPLPPKILQKFDLANLILRDLSKDFS